MRVLIDYRPALRQRSGAGEYTHQLVRALLVAFRLVAPAQGLEITVFSSSWKDRLELSDGELAGVKTIDRRIPVRVLNFAWHRLEWPPAEVLAGAFDVTHSSHPLMLPSRHAARVITIHDLNFLEHSDRTRAEIRRDYPVLVRDHAHRADGIVVPSRFTAGEIERKLNVPVERISICPPGAPDWPPRRSAQPDGYVLFLGTLEPRKNVGGLLDAYERLLTCRTGNLPRLVLAGQATAESQPWLDRIARPPLRAVVSHIGYVDPGRRRELYEGARLLVQPSFEEGFGLPVLEAMTLGVPVVASSRGALPEVVGDAGPLVDPDAPDELASAIARVLDDASFEAACAAKGVIQSRHFRWERTAQLVYETYQRALLHRQCASA